MEAYNGGIITNYVDTSIPIGVVNTETTALVVLANPLFAPITTTTTSSTAPTWLVTISTYLEILIALAVILVILNAMVLVSLIRRRTR